MQQKIASAAHPDSTVSEDAGIKPRARTYKPFKEPRNRFLGIDRFLGSLNVLQILTQVCCYFGHWQTEAQTILARFHPHSARVQILRGTPFCHKPSNPVLNTVFRSLSRNQPCRLPSLLTKPVCMHHTGDQFFLNLDSDNTHGLSIAQDSAAIARFSVSWSKTPS